MTLDQIIPQATMLPLEEREKLVEIFNEKSKEVRELLDRLVRGGQYEIWTPFDSYEAAAVIQKLLGQTKNDQNVG